MVNPVPVDPALLEPHLAAVRSGAFESWDAARILGWAIENFHPRLVLSASFGAPEGMVLLDMLHQVMQMLGSGSNHGQRDVGTFTNAAHDVIGRDAHDAGVADGFGGSGVARAGESNRLAEAVPPGHDVNDRFLT